VVTVAVPVAPLAGDGAVTESLLPAASYEYEVVTLVWALWVP
jgi:hypothetical protein